MTQQRTRAPMKKLLAALAVVLMMPGVSPEPAAAQRDDTLVNLGGLEMTRTALEDLLDYYQDVVSSPGYSGRLRERARNGIALIRTRLEQGDFRIGDRVIMSVQGEWPTPDTFPVEAGPEITLPVMGKISLRGVLRSELESHMTKELGRFIQNPVVRAESLIRITILGEVGNPGFHTVPARRLLGEALMQAGGPGQAADLDRLYIERQESGQTRRIWDGDAIQDAMAQGFTLDQMNLRAGDIIQLPQMPTRSIWQGVARYGLVLGTALIFGIRIWF